MTKVFNIDPSSEFPNSIHKRIMMLHVDALLFEYPFGRSLQDKYTHRHDIVTISICVPQGYDHMCMHVHSYYDVFLG